MRSKTQLPTRHGLAKEPNCFVGQISSLYFLISGRFLYRVRSSNSITCRFDKASVFYNDVCSLLIKLIIYQICLCWLSSTSYRCWPSVVVVLYRSILSQIKKGISNKYSIMEVANKLLCRSSACGLTNYPDRCVQEYKCMYLQPTACGVFGRNLLRLFLPSAEY